ncbi:hypothetical protein NDU88_005062 [Pleurodeles waltl]|uniref:Uncharacterized protein n=1 Tax=Pleurodeles waltl TaxID=8319 RepID=A0AAV7SKR6_PLEWA|nr:hypothetical protein NDU88_005062 [Pleurodeles waltl]
MPVAESHRGDFKPQLPELEGEAYASRVSRSPQLQLRQLPTRESAGAAEAHAPHTHRLGLTMRPGWQARPPARVREQTPAGNLPDTSDAISGGMSRAKGCRKG